VHLAVGWIYFGAAWLSLVVINGILSFMLTPGDWITTRSFWDGVLNPTYLPSVVARTAGAVGLAGVYALMTAAWMTDGQLKARVARYAGLRWVVPAALVLPVSFWWYLSAAAGAGIPVREIFGAPAMSLTAIVSAAFSGPASGHPIAQRAVVALTIASVVLLLVTVATVSWRRTAFGRISAGVAMASAFVMLGSAEWIREDLRKPYVIGGYMFVTGVRVSPPAAVPLPGGPDRLAIAAISEAGVLESALWARQQASTGDTTRDEIARGHELFRLSCAACHTTDGYLALRPQVTGISVAGAGGLLARLARPVDAHGAPSLWGAADTQLVSWRDRMMPPFPGTPDERRSLAVYLAHLGGASPEAIAHAEKAAALGARLFDENCSACHARDADYPFDPKGRQADELYALLGRLPQVNDIMPAFEGSDAERRSLADYLATLGPAHDGGAR
jgi:mono/diheme cytochrome c family protein